MIVSTPLAAYTAQAHHAAVVDLLERSLLPEDAVEAAEITDLAARHGSGLVALAGDRVVGVALAGAGHRDPGTAHLHLLAVDPAHRRRGVARELLTALEARLAAQGFPAVRVAGNPPDHAWPGVDVRYTPAICALTSLGYVQDRTAWNMTVDLTRGSAALRPTSDTVDRLAAAGVEVRRAVRDDLDTLLPMVTLEWGDAWATEVRRAVDGAGGCHLALRDGRPVAFAAWGGCRPSWFGPMGTLPTAGGQGIGGVLLRRCLADQAARGLTSAQIGWVGPVPFYARAADAVIERVFFLFGKPLATAA